MKLICNQSFRASAAFTLIDVMVGVAVLGIVLLSLFASFAFGFKVVKLSREDLQATQLLQEKMESIRLYSWQQVTQDANLSFTNPLGTTGPDFFHGTVSSTVPVFSDGAAYSNEVRKITVTLTWTNDNLKHTRSSSTYVSHYGLLNYTLN